MAYELITVNETHEGGVTEIVLGPPPANIVSAQMMEEISSQLKEDKKNPHKKLITFKGEGKHFSFGASVEEHAPDQVDDMLPGFHKMIRDVLNTDIPTLAQVSGLSLGGGFELAMACSLVFAEEGAKFGVPEIQLAVFPPVAAVLLPFRCGDVVASEFILTGDQFTAQHLQARGLVNQVAQSGQLDSMVSEFYEKQLSRKSASSLRIATKASRMMVREAYDSYISKLETLYLKELMSTKDAVEGIQSFLDKRKPKWLDE